MATGVQAVGAGIQMRGEGVQMRKKIRLSIHRKAWVLSLKRGDSTETQAARETEYREALADYAEEIARTRGANAAAQYALGEKTIFGRINRERYGRQIAIALGIGAVLATGVGLAAIGAVGLSELGIAAGTYVAAKLPSFALGFIISQILLSPLARGVTEFALLGRIAQQYGLNRSDLSPIRRAEALVNARKQMNRGMSFAELLKTKDGRVIEASAHLEKYKSRAVIGTGLAVGVGSVYIDGAGLAGSLIKSATGSTHSFEGAFVSTTGLEDMYHTFGVVGHRVHELFAFLFGMAVSPASAAPAETSTDFHHPNEGKVPKSITHFGDDPFTNPADLEKNFDMRVARAADELAREGNWSPEQKAAFIKACQESKSEIIAGFKGQTPVGTIKSGSLIYSMMNGEKPGNGVNVADGPYKYTGPDTRAVLMEYGWTDAHGVRHTGLVALPLECGNFSDLGELPTEQPVEIIPPIESECDHWRSKILDISITIDGQPFTKAIELRAPMGMTMNQAVLDLKERIASGELKIKDGSRFLISIDRDCDGIPEEIDCASVKVVDGHIKICAEPLNVAPTETTYGRSHQKPYASLNLDQRRSWYTR